MPIAPVGLKRRDWLQAVLGASVWAAPWAWAGASQGRLVLVFLRGAYDGLSALVPYGDPNYYRLRSSTAIAAPDGSAQSALALDAQFGLHPALAPLLPLWQEGVLAVVPAAGLPDATRSHFDAQHQWEVGMVGHSGAAVGWMNRLAGMPASAVAQALCVGEANPQILEGPAAVERVPRGAAALRSGSLGDARTHDALLRLYSGQDELAQAFRAGAESRMQTADTLLADALASQGTLAQDMGAANNGAGPAQGLLQDARHLGTLMRQNRQLRLGFLSAGGWDTHANQGGAGGLLARNLKGLAAALVQLRRDFSEPNDVVLVCSEFGRTCAENGTGGTDHGHGNALWLLGNRIQGGRWHGRWDGLAVENLHEGRDLPVHHDFRAVFAQVLRTTQGLSDSALQTLFPGLAWDARLDAKLRV